MKKFIYAVVGFACICIALYAGSPWVLEEAVKQQLAKYHLQTDIEFNHPKPGILSIPSLTLMSKSPNALGQVQLKKLSIKYDWYELITLQRVQRIEIDQLEVSLEKLKLNTESSSQPLDLSTVLPQHLFDQLMFDELSVKTFSVKLPSQLVTNLTKIPALKSANLLFTGQLTLDSNHLDLTSRYSENSQLIANITLQANRNNQLDLQTTLVDDSLKTDTHLQTKPPFFQRLKGSITEESSKLSLDFDHELTLQNFVSTSIWVNSLLPHPIKNQLSNSSFHATLNHQIEVAKAFIGPDSFTAFKSAFTIKAESLRPEQLISSSTASLNSTFAQIGKGNLAISGQLSKEGDAFKLVLDQGSRASLDKITARDLTTDQVTARLRAPLEFTCDLSCQSDSDSPQIAPKLSATVIELSATDWQTQLGKLSHQPIVIKINKVDLANQELIAEYKNLSLELTRNSQQSPLPISFLSIQSAGELKWAQQQLTAKIKTPLDISIKGIALNDISNEQLSIKTNRDIELVAIPKTHSIIFDNADLTVAKSQWQIPLATLKHQALNVSVSDFNLLNQRAKFAIASPSVKFFSKALPFKTLETTIAASGQLADNTLDLVIDKKQPVTVTKLAIDELRTNKLTITNTKKVRLKLPFDSHKATLDLNQLSAKGLGFSIRSTPISFDKHKLRFKNAYINLNLIKLTPFKASATSSLRSVQLAIPKIDKVLQTFDVTASHWLSAKSYNNTFKLKNKSLSLTMEGKLKATQLFKNVDATWQINPFPLDLITIQQLRKASDLWPAQLLIVNGNYASKGKLKVRGSKVTAQIDHQVKDLSLLRDKLLTSGISAQSKTLFKNNKLTQSGNLKIADINSTVPIKQISAQYLVNDLLSTKPQLKLRKLGADVLGTRIKIKQLDANLAPIKTSGLIEFTQLPLNNILALENQPSLNGEGMLEGKLPFRLNDKQLWVENGKVNSIGNGIIRYLANDKIRALANTNQGLGIAVNVLEDFHYDNLSITANYSPDGKLLLANRLSGKNPNWQNGQPIDFSINIEENLLKLLKTLQFSDELEQKLQRKVQGKVN